MKRILVAAGLIFASASAVIGQSHVDGHTRRDGTYVAPHYRSAPDNSYNNNWNVSPNSNPYTGQRGTNQPTYNDRPPPANSYGGGGLYGSPRYR